jgi:phosphosulfolactate synthase
VGEPASFLDLPTRSTKPRDRGLTHVLDKGVPPTLLDPILGQVGSVIDILKVGWGIGYLDPGLKERAARCADADVLVCLGGTLVELAAAAGRVEELRRWAADRGVPAVEVSNGLGALDRRAKAALVRDLSRDFVVLAETGAKDDREPVVADWLVEMAADLDAGARWVVAEGRESGTVGLFHRDATVREELVEAVAEHLPLDRVVFEAPVKAQQVWFVRRFGADVNLGNIALAEVLPVETLRLGLRADTASLVPERGR